VLLAALAAIPLGCVGPQHSYGPLPVRNQHPAQLTVMHLDPVPAQPLRAGAVAGRASFAYTSLFLAGSGHGNSITMDGEVLRSSLQARVGLGNGFEFGAELPVLYASGGFLDSFLIDYHGIFGFPDQDRDIAPKNQFNVHADFQGTRVYELDDGPMLGDLPLSLTCGIIAPRLGSPGVALRLGAELPTGDADAGAGNGKTDFATGLCASWLFSFATLHAAVQYTFTGTPEHARQAGFEFRDVASANAAIEWPLLDDLAGLVQVEWETSTLRQLDFARAADDQVLLWLGGRLRVDRDLFVELSLGEDLAPEVSPDFTAWLAIAWLPGAARGRGAD